MTRKHKLYFLLWKFIQRLRGLKVGTIVKIWSGEKDKFIKGCITNFVGVSVDSKKSRFFLSVELVEPLEIDNLNAYIIRGFDVKGFKYNPIDKTFYFI